MAFKIIKSSKNILGSGMTLGTAEHRQLVCSLYKKSLKLSHDWIFKRHKWRPFAIGIRQQFDAHRGESDPQRVELLIKATQYLLWKYRHPEPYLCN